MATNNTSISAEARAVLFFEIRDMFKHVKEGVVEFGDTSIQRYNDQIVLSNGGTVMHFLKWIGDNVIAELYEDELLKRQEEVSVGTYMCQIKFMPIGMMADIICWCLHEAPKTEVVF